MAHSFEASTIAYAETGRFSSIVNDYTSHPEKLTNFFRHPNTYAGLMAALESRKKYGTNRKLLVEQLKQQYQGLKISDEVSSNIDSLLDVNTFTLCTAHQPNIFTGHLYFIYKILHTIKLSDELNDKLPDKKFVPVFYMGTEDADLEELGHIYIRGKKYEWKTKQKGAVGRMFVDDALIVLLKEISGQLSVFPYGKKIIELLSACYRKGSTIQQATLEIVNSLFGGYGLIVLIPDNAALKKVMIDVLEDDILNNHTSGLVQEVSEKLSVHYKVQANPRDINVFYLKDDIRNRIVKKGDKFFVLDTDISFSVDELKEELNHHPERFSPNVILRGLYQEMILPNIAFIGGGGELAYWLQLEKLFTAYKVPYPVLILRNSFMLIRKNIAEAISKSFSLRDIFKRKIDLMNQVVKQNSSTLPDHSEKLKHITSIYNDIETDASKVDVTLQKHVRALQVAALKKLHTLQTKMERAERKKFEAEQRTIKRINDELFPGGSLQERVENFILFYAMWGDDLMKQLYQYSFGLEQKFVILTEKTER